MNNYYKNKITWCPICDQGWVEIMKLTDNKFIVVCAECNVYWQSPINIKDLDKAKSCDYCFCDPSDEEIKDIGWDKYILIK